MSDLSKRTNSEKAVKDLISTKSGPFEAIVVSHLDSKYMGSLKVDLLRKNSSGSLPERFGTTITVKYLSPFYGVTNLDHATANDGYASTQKSYGFWAVPPDPGTQVLVIFAENDINRGYWIGCIQDDYMNFMVPDGRASTELTTDATPTNLKGQKLPTGEYNKKVQTGVGKDPTRFQKPYNKDFTQILEVQGLQQDEYRGTTSTSARREVPSAVFGWSTPGPVDKREGAPKGKYGEYGYQANVFVNRLGGSSFVMDDGDDKLIRQTHAAEGPPNYSNVESGNRQGDRTIPHNEMLRFRTRTGHQILLHNSEDLIYIGNARGTSWIEMTSDGKIDIYARDSISVHSDADLNFTADRDVNIEAGRNLNMRASARYNNYSDPNAGNIQIESKYNTSILVESNLSVDVKGSETHRVGSDRTVYVVGSSSHKTEDSLTVSAGNNISHKSQSILSDSSGPTSIKAGGLIGIDGSEIYANSRVAASAPSASTAPPVSPLITHTVPKVSPGVLTPSDVTSIVKRMPSHEPWPHHENLNPAEYKSEKTDINNSTGLKNSFFLQNADTFLKSGIGGTSTGGSGSGNSVTSSGSRPANPIYENVSAAGNLLDVIAKAESGSDYNVVYTGIKITPENFYGRQLTQLTVEEVLKWQVENRRRNTASTAAGKYQIIYKTLLGIVNSGILSPSEKFNAAAQDRAAEYLLQGRGISRYISGSIDEITFANNIAKEWASMPVVSKIQGQRRVVNPGESYYSGDGLNKSLVTTQEVIAAIKALRPTTNTTTASGLDDGLRGSPPTPPTKTS